MAAARTVDPNNVTLIPATDNDREFSYQVKKAAEGTCIETNWGWDEGLQRRFHAKDWAERRPDIIRYDGKRVGTVYVREEDGAIWIRQFFILPEYQNKGIGSVLLRRILAEADHAGRVSRVAFLEGNRVESLYIRFGFRSTGQRHKYCFMAREPQNKEQLTGEEAGPATSAAGTNRSRLSTEARDRL